MPSKPPGKKPDSPKPAPKRPPLAPAPGLPPVGPLPSASGDVSLGVAVAGGRVGRDGHGAEGRAACATWRWRSTPTRSASRRRSSTWPRRSTSPSRPTTARTTSNRSTRRRSSAAARSTIVHQEYFGFGDTWFGQFGRLLRSLQLTLEGPDPASPEGQQRIDEKGPASIRGILNLIGRKLDLVAEYEDRVPAYVEQMFDRLEASGIIVGWDRDDWEIWTTTIGLDIRIGSTTRRNRRDTRDTKAESGIVNRRSPLCPSRHRG